MYVLLWLSNKHFLFIAFSVSVLTSTIRICFVLFPLIIQSEATCRRSIYPLGVWAKFVGQFARAGWSLELESSIIGFVDAMDGLGGFEKKVVDILYSKCNYNVKFFACEVHTLVADMVIQLNFNPQIEFYEGNRVLWVRKFCS